LKQAHFYLPSAENALQHSNPEQATKVIPMAVSGQWADAELETAFMPSHGQAEKAVYIDHSRR
tara:strand:+ start:9843 stop:10031 length:189 start_codon:yes stop_codon:yes gene_type:complete